MLYWTGNPYLALGAGAHGFIPHGKEARRVANIRKYNEYIRAALDTGEPTAEEEVIDPPTHAIERLMTGLRLTNGVCVEAIQTVTGVDVARQYESEFAELVDQGLLIREGTHIRLSEKAIPVSDAVFVRFF